MKIRIQNGRLIDPASQTDQLADVYIAAGRIIALGEAPAGFEAEGVIEARDCIVCPGLVDLAVRLREPGNEYRATLESEMAAAAAGGVTSLACPPDTDPPLDEPGLVEMLKHRTRLPEYAHVYPVGALTLRLAGERLTEMAELHEAGCIAFGQANAPVIDTQVLLRAMQYAATFDFPIWLQAQDPFLARDGMAHDGAVAGRLGLIGIPLAAETIALATILQLARATGARVHVTRVSSAAALQMIQTARKNGIKVSCDVAIHHLHLDETAIGHFDTHARLDPPLRSASDREALRQGLADGTINALCSDHTPVDDDAKQRPFAEAEAGASGLELLLPLTLKWAREMQLPLHQALARITSDPARILGIETGRVALGAVADLCVFSEFETSCISRSNLRSQGKNTPFLNQTLPGRVRYTLTAGHLAYSAPLA